MLSCETKEMSKDDIVNATYEAAERLNDFKLKYRLIDYTAHLDIKKKIDQSKAYIKRIDYLLTLSAAEQAAELEKIKKEIEQCNHYSICSKNELKWEVPKN